MAPRNNVSDGPTWQDYRHHCSDGVAYLAVRHWAIFYALCYGTSTDFRYNDYSPLEYHNDATQSSVFVSLD